jgi:peptidoglycan/xylan/chitin deacetylase (PgdA/CDA1 family)
MRAILMYHSIDSSGSPISLSEEVFRAHVRFLGSGRVRVVPLATISSLPDETDAVALTFDDGFLNFTSSALPVLSHQGFPATVFVVSDAVGSNNDWGGRPSPGIPTLPLMSWSDLRRLRDSGFEVGAHTRTHPDLTTLSPTQLQDEMAGCAARIAAELGQKPGAFAYPYGAVNDGVASIARRLFQESVTTELRSLAPDDDVALLPRLDAWYFRKPGTLETWGSPTFRRRLWVRSRGRRVREVMTRRGRDQ